jgi:Tol biopolymer transport system component
VRLLPLALIAAVAAALPTAAAAPSADESLVFSTRRTDGAWSLHTIRANGSRDRALTHGIPFGAAPAWSPDGSRIAFRDIGATQEIWTMRPDGSDRRRILRTTNAVTDGSHHEFLELEWSPDGKRIAFGDVQGRIRVLTLRTGKVDAIGPQRATSPSFAPDGKRIAFERLDARGERSVWTMDVDGTNVRTLAVGESPAWSPTGDLIAFTGQVKDDDGSVRDHPLFLMRPDGSGRRAVTNHGLDEDPAWSPDGTQIAMAASGGRPLVDGLVVMNRDGSGMRLISDLLYAEQASWSPDGHTVAFGAQGSLYTVAVEGSARPVPVLSPREDYAATWSPDATLLAVDRYDAVRWDAVRDFSGLPLLDRSGTLVRLLDAPLYGRVSWSPDGDRIVGANSGGIAVVDIETGESEQIIHRGDDDPGTFEPAWSRDGHTIAYVVDPGDEGGSLALYNLRTRRHHELRIAGERPAWSPDGKRLAFERPTRCGGQRCTGVFTYHLRTRRVKLLARNASEPAWSPDGRRIAFVRRTSRTNTDIYVMRADGSNERRVTRTPGLEAAPDWQPRPGALR